MLSDASHTRQDDNFAMYFTEAIWWFVPPAAHWRSGMEEISVKCHLTTESLLSILDVVSKCAETPVGRLSVY
jgi:hypothetical protein